MRRLFIHIGAPKTGSTAIQHFLADERAALLRHGILYPAAATIGKAHHAIGAAIFPGRAGRLGGVPRDAALARALADVHAEIERHQPTTVILSTEYLWGVLSPDRIRRLLAAFPDWRVHVVAYLRRQDLLAQSLYIQAVKAGHAGGFHEWLEHSQAGSKAPFDFFRVLRSWSGCGADVIVRVYETGSITPDVRVDFLETVGAGTAVAPPAGNRAVNTTPDATTVELLRVVNREIADPDVANRLRRRIMRSSPARAPFAPLPYLGHEEAALFVARFAEGNRRVAQEFLGRADGVLFRDPLPGPRAEPAEGRGKKGERE
ncbi:MAG: hypothetical protein ACK4ST_02040, partial [Elioraea tepidiphila]